MNLFVCKFSHVKSHCDTSDDIAMNILGKSATPKLYMKIRGTKDDETYSIELICLKLYVYYTMP